VDEVLSSHRMGNGSVIGEELTVKLKRECEPSVTERRFLIRTICRHLMYNCAV